MSDEAVVEQDPSVVSKRGRKKIIPDDGVIRVSEDDLKKVVELQLTRNQAKKLLKPNENKKPRSEKQQQTFEKMLQARAEKRQLEKEEKEKMKALEEQKKKEEEMKKVTITVKPKRPYVRKIPKIVTVESQADDTEELETETTETEPEVRRGRRRIQKALKLQEEIKHLKSIDIPEKPTNPFGHLFKKWIR